MARFAADCEPLLASGRFGLAVSGGPDSLALLLLAHAAFPGRFDVATVDHGLRPESADEAAMVGQVCSERGIAHATLLVTPASTGNLQAEAREVRYAALGDWAHARELAAIATAHHRDDQAETLLMRLNRGAGVRGLASMRPLAPMPGHPDIALVRPLLGWTRNELGALVIAAGLDTAADSSNTDPRFARVALRQVMKEAEWLDPAALARSAEACAQADAALDWVAQRETSEQVVFGAEHALYTPSAPQAVRLRVLERVIAVLGREGTPRGSELARLLATLEVGGVATLGGVRADGSALPWRFAPAAPRRA